MRIKVKKDMKIIYNKSKLVIFFITKDLCFIVHCKGLLWIIYKNEFENDIDDSNESF
jgi:hypothetical protein